MAKRTMNSKAARDDTKNVLCALCYPLWPVALVLLIIQESKPLNERDMQLRHHAYNGLGFFIGALIVSIPVWLLSWFPVLGAVLVVLFWIAMIALAIIYALRAYRGEPVIVPVMTAFLEENVKGFSRH